MEQIPEVLGISISELRIPVPWGHIAAKAYGDPVNGKPVLTVHGWLDNAGTFDELIPLLPKSLYVVSIDLPGHGYSSHLPAGIPYHYIDFVATLRRIVNYLKWTRFYYMGHSFGASLGFLYATLFPDQIERLVLLDLVKPLEKPTEEIITGIHLFQEHDDRQLQENSGKQLLYTYEMILKRLLLGFQYNSYPLTEAAAKLLLVSPPHDLEDLKLCMENWRLKFNTIANYFIENVDQPKRGCQKVNDNDWVFTRDNRVIPFSILRWLTNEELFDMMKEQKCHVLLVKSTEGTWFQSPMIYEKTMRMYREICPSFKLVKVPGNHFVHLTNPLRVAGPVEDFLYAKN